MSGAIAQRANTTSKALGGKASYLWATFAVFARWTPTDLEVTVDGEHRRGRMHDVVVANGRYFGGGMKICPEAAPDDGLFDVLTIGDVTKRDLVTTMPKIYRGTHLPHPKAELLRGAVVTIDEVEPIPVELDGEQPGTTPARFEVLPRRPSAPGPPGGRRLGRRPCAGRSAAARAASGPGVSAATLLLEPRHALLEGVDPADALRELVDPLLQVVEGLEARVPPGRSASRWIACSPLPARRAITSASVVSVSLFVAMAQSYHAARRFRRGC